LGLIAIVVVRFWIVPYTVTVTDKIFAFGFLFSLLTALTLKVGSSANWFLTQAYLTRRKRRAKSDE
jgi:hypothetical protein